MADIHLQKKQPHTWTIIFAILIAVLIIMFLIIRHNSSPQVAQAASPGTSAIATTIPSESRTSDNADVVADYPPPAGDSTLLAAGGSNNAPSSAPAPSAPAPSAPAPAPAPSAPAPSAPAPAPSAPAPSAPAPAPSAPSAPAPAPAPSAPAPVHSPAPSAPAPSAPAPVHSPAPSAPAPAPSTPAPSPHPGTAPPAGGEHMGGDHSGGGPAPEPTPHNAPAPPSSPKPESHPQPEPHPQHETHPQPKNNTGGGPVVEPKNNKNPETHQQQQTRPQHENNTGGGPKSNQTQNRNQVQHPAQIQNANQLRNRPMYNERGELENRTIFIDHHHEGHPNHFHGYYDYDGRYFENGFWWPFEVGVFTDYLLFDYPYGYVSNEAGYPYVADGIVSLANALYAVSEQSNTAPASRDIYRENLINLANQLQTTPSGINAGELTSDAFIQAADWMQEISDQRFPNAQNEVNQAESAARRINTNLLLQDQQHAVKRFFDDSRIAIQALKP